MCKDKQFKFKEQYVVRRNLEWSAILPIYVTFGSMIHCPEMPAGLSRDSTGSNLHDLINDQRIPGSGL
jgi:hypothetical protein